MVNKNQHNTMFEAQAVVCENFSGIYFDLHDYVYKHGQEISSRNGLTREVLDFKTRINNPIQRCVAGYKRDMNIFFLIAESIWIFAGRRDVEFLEPFNSKLKDYSDDGKYYNAPYGWRLRKYGVDSMQNFDEENMHHLDGGRDQILEGVLKLAKKADDRRVVLSVWNPDFDVATSKDNACNSMLMWKVRPEGFYQTIQNRSNDLDWGLTTNVFQFGFIGEIVSNILGVKYAGQTHNSQSLHLYDWNPLTKSIQLEFNYPQNYFHVDFYKWVETCPINFTFDESIEGDLNSQEALVKARFLKADMTIQRVIYGVIGCKEKLQAVQLEEFEEYRNGVFDVIKKCDECLALYFYLLTEYMFYKLIHKNHKNALQRVYSFAAENNAAKYDFIVLALNFFLRRIKDKHGEQSKNFDEACKYLTSNEKFYYDLPIGNL